MGWKHYQVGSGLFGIRLLLLHLKFQFSKSIKSSTFHISHRFNLSFEKKIFLSKNAHMNIYTKPPNSG